MAYYIGTYINIMSNGLLRDEELISPPGAPENDSVVGLITADLVQTYNNLVIPYDGESNTASADFRRTVDDMESYPFIVPQFINGEPLAESSQSSFTKLRYIVSCYIANINDESDEAISEVLKNVQAYLIKQAMVDITRGGNAVNTNIGAFGEYFIDNPNYVEFVSWIELLIKTFIDSGDPFVRTG